MAGGEAVDQGCAVEDSWIAPDTFLGTLAELKGSLAWGNLLINWRTGSHTWVPDPFLLSSLSEEEQEERPVTTPSPAMATPFARRIEGVISLAQKL